MKTGLLKRTLSLMLSMFMLFSSIGGEVALAANTDTGSVQEETVTNKVTEQKNVKPAKEAGNIKVAVEPAEPVVVEESEKKQLDNEFEIKKRQRSATKIVAGNTYSTATNVELNKTYTSTFTDNDAFYKFTLSKPGIVNLVFNNNAEDTTDWGIFILHMMGFRKNPYIVLI